MNRQNNLKICHWNARGLKNKIAETFNFLVSNDIDIILISETWLKSTDVVLKNSNFKCYRLDRMDKRGGGVCIIIKKNIKHSLLPLFATKVIEAIGISVLSNGNSFTITSCYFSRQKISANTLVLFRNDIRLLTRTADPFFFICGDFNARHRFWGCLKANQTGNVLYDELLKNNFSVEYPPTHTYHPSSSRANSSTLDLLITNNPGLIASINVANDLASDHLAVITQISCVIQTATDTILNFNYSMANWPKFRYKINSKLKLSSTTMSELNTPSRIDDYIAYLNKLILDAANDSIPKYSCNSSKNDLQLTDEIIYLIKIKNSVRRTYQRYRSNALRIYLKMMKNTIQQKIIDLRNERWNQFLSKFQASSPQFWKTTKLIKNKHRFLPPLRYNDNLLITDYEKCECIANQFSKSHLISSGLGDHDIIEEVNSSLNFINSSEVNFSSIRLVKPAEIKNNIKRLKNKKCPGNDGICNRVIKKCPKQVLILLTYIFNACFKLSYFPSNWKSAVIVPVPKPKKDIALPESYRPISLLNCFSKLFENSILERINDHLSSHNILPPQQFGFRSGHSTNHQVLRLVNDIRNNNNSRISSGIVLLDIEKAFDNVWHDALVHKMQMVRIPLYLTKITKSYLTERSFKVNINGSYSHSLPIPAGVPQGAVLSPTLYNIFMHDIPRPVNCSLYMYADDAAIMSESLCPNTIINNLESGINLMNTHFNRWRIKLNINKTQSAFFTKRRKSCFLPQRQIILDGQSIPWDNNIKYLGVVLDKNLTFSQHIYSSIKKCNLFTRILYPFINRKSKLSLRNKIVIYKSIFRQILTFAAPIWYNCAKTHISKLQISQNKLLKMIHNLPFFYSTIRLHEISNIVSIKLFIDKLTNKFRNKLEFANNPLISALR